MPDDDDASTPAINQNSTFPIEEKNDDANNEIRKEPTLENINISGRQHQDFFRTGTTRKKMQPKLENEANESEQENEYKSRVRNTELYYKPADAKECQLSLGNTKNGMRHLSRFSFNKAPKLNYENNLSPDFYQPFLQELFALFTKNKFINSFILTGSAAKQLQNTSERNPNDIDILLKNDDLVEGTMKFKTVLAQMNGVSIAGDDQAGTLGINYQETLFKIQLIDYQTSRHCFPMKEDLDKLQNNDAIIMLDALVIPKKEESDTDDDDCSSEIEITEIIKFR